VLLLKAAAAFVSSLAASWLVTPKVIEYSRRKGYLGRDVHKPGQPLIPEMGGLSILVGVAVGSVICCLLALNVEPWIVVFTCCTMIAGGIGALDYLVTLTGVTKTALTVIACLPLIVGAVLWPKHIVIGRPELPFIGTMRFTIIYWILLPFAVAAPANAVNMIDTFNGVMPITSSFSVLGLLVASLILGRWEALLMCCILLGALLGYMPYNLYPSKVFTSDVGSLAVGAAIGVIAVVGRLEIVGIVALMPQIMNSFYILSSVKGLLERRQIRERPTVVLGDNVVAANRSERAPLTLANLILSRGPLKEPELVKRYAILSFSSFILSVVTAVLMVVT